MASRKVLKIKDFLKQRKDGALNPTMTKTIRCDVCNVGNGRTET